MLFYYAANDPDQANRIVWKGFCGLDGITVKLPYDGPKFVDQPGILVSSELDPSTGFAVELDLQINVAVYLRRHELISHVPGVRYYIFFIGVTDKARRRVVRDDEIVAARSAGVEKWQHRPLVWFGKE